MLLHLITNFVVFFAHGNPERAKKAFDTLNCGGCFQSDNVKELKAARKYFENLT